MDNGGTRLLEKFILYSVGSQHISEEYYKYFKFAPLIISFFLITLFLTPIVGKIALKLGILNATRTDHENNRFNRYENDERRINPNRVPLLGGLAVVVPLYLAIPIFLGLNSLTVPLLIALTILLVYGVVDDAYDLPATSQFLIQLIVALVVVLTIHDLKIIKVPFDGVLDVEWARWEWKIWSSNLALIFPGDLITVLWIMICMNAVKWVNGLDGLMETNMIIAYILLFIIGIRADLMPIIVISAMLVGSISAFTIFNFPPAKIFSSATGSLPYGFMIATLSLVNQTKFATTIIILMLPLVDFLFVLIKRLTIYKPKGIKAILKTPVQLMRMADTNHFHHQLLKLNLTNRQIVFVEVLVSMFIGSLAILSADAFRLFIVFAGGLLMGVAIFLIHLLTSKKKIKELEAAKRQETPESRYSY